MEDKLDRQYILVRVTHYKTLYKQGVISIETLKIVCKELMDVIHYHNSLIISDIDSI